MQTILEFIEVFNSPANRILFSESACYWFAVILHERFSESLIVYNPHQVHFATKIRGRIYDIGGVVEDDSEFINWEIYRKKSPDVSMICKYCINLERR